MAKRILWGLVAALGVVTAVLGFMAAFKELSDTFQGSVKELHSGDTSSYSDDLDREIRMAYLGGLVSGILGIVVALVGGAMVFKSSGWGFLITMIVVVLILVLFGGLGTLGAANNLNDMNWIKDHDDKIYKGLLILHNIKTP